MKCTQYTNEPHENNPQLFDFFSENYLGYFWVTKDY